MHYSILQCPQCRNLLDTRILSLCSGLGPSVVLCGKCGRTIHAPRKEFAQFRVGDHIRFFLLSAVYVMFLAFLGGLAGGFAYPSSAATWIERSPFNAGFGIGAALLGFAVLVVQYQRVTASFRRTADKVQQPYRQALFELQTGLQHKACIVLVSAGLLVGAVSYALSRH